MLQVDPLSILSIIFIQIGNKHLVFDLTDKQKNILKHPIMQFLILLSLIYLSTKNIFLAFVIALSIYVFLYILFNENSPFSILMDEFDIEDLYYSYIK